MGAFDGREARRLRGSVAELRIGISRGDDRLGGNWRFQIPKRRLT